SRWARGRAAWSTSDGLVKAAPAIKSALDAQRLGRRPYSLSALQRFATCPYQFLLATIYRLEPWDEPEPLVRMDPLTRGSLFHTAQAEFYRTMQARGALPIDKAHVADAVKTLDAVLDRVAENYAETLAPAIERVWRDEIGELQGELYSVAVERALGKKVASGRYYYATTVGGFVDKEISIDGYARAQGLQVLAIIDRAVETGFLAAAPDERACTWCDFRPVCGPHEEKRTGRKAREPLADLEALRGMR